jgi:hypothetical protein
LFTPDTGVGTISQWPTQKGNLFSDIQFDGPFRVPCHTRRIPVLADTGSISSTTYGGMDIHYKFNLHPLHRYDMAVQCLRCGKGEHVYYKKRTLTKKDRIPKKQISA